MCLDAGVNLIDTADVYSRGLSEEIVGEAHRRAAATTSCSPPRSACRWAPGPNDAGLSRHHIIAGCEASLRRLGTDHIDLYQVHEWDGATPLEETLARAGLPGAVRQGPLRRALELRRLAADEGARHVRPARPAALRQPADLLLAAGPRRRVRARSRPRSTRASGVLVWSPLAGGLLSGKYRRGETAPEGSRQLTDWNEPPVHDEDQLYDTVDVLVEIADGARRLGRPGGAGVRCWPSRP